MDETITLCGQADTCNFTTDLKAYCFVSLISLLLVSSDVLVNYCCEITSRSPDSERVKFSTIFAYCSAVIYVINVMLKSFEMLVLCSAVKV